MGNKASSRSVGENEDDEDDDDGENEFHELVKSEDLTLEALQPALDALAPGDVEQKLGAMDDVRPAAPARHVR